MPRIVVRRVKRTFTFIISYPLEFAKRMIRGVGDGFSHSFDRLRARFGKNIKSHLINTLAGWLTGALVD